MRVTFIIGSFGAGGKERQLLYLIKGLMNSSSIQVIIFNEDVFYQELFELTVDIVFIRRQERYSLGAVRKVYSELKRFKPEVIHTWDNISHCIALPYVVKNKVKVVNGSIRYAGKIKKSLFFKITQKLSFITADIIVSNSNAGLVVENLLSNRKAKCVHNGFDHKLYIEDKTDLPKEILNIRKQFYFSVVMVGRFDSAKDYNTFIQSAKLTVKQDSSIAFICIGDGPNLNQIEKYAAPLLNKNVFFLGKRDDVQKIIHGFDIGVLLNDTNGHAEGISNAIMEYMAAGLPVIATNAGGTTELVKDGESGFLVPPFNPEIVAEKIHFFLQNGKKRKDMGVRGMKIIEEKFSLEKMLYSYLTLYETIIK